jgi:hypothetical protein
MGKIVDLQFDEITRSKLVESVKKFKKTRNEMLWPVFEELIVALERGAAIDAYMARYLRDTINLGEKGNDSFKPIVEKLDALF